MRYNIRMKFLTIEQALAWITSQRRDGSKFERFLNVVNKLNHPESALKIIHVAGTNGKGSTVAFLRDGLMALGYKVGTLTSPHLETHLDRIRVNDCNIDADSFLEILNDYYDFFVQEELNMFEMDYLIMVEYFTRMKVDFAIVEVGMGGRLDSTNVVENPILSIITTIGLDHTKELGATKELICKEKCGIIKNHGHVLVGDLEEGCLNVVKETVLAKQADLRTIKAYQEIEPRVFKYDGEIFKIESYAKYQYHNASLAIAALKYLNDLGYIDYDYVRVRAAMEKSHWAGRFEVLQQDPLVIIDGAHNIDGVKALCESIDAIDMPKVLLFSAIKTKKYDTMIEILKKHFDKIIMTSFEHPLIIDSEKVAKNHELEYCSDFKETYQKLIKDYPCVVISGSLYFVSTFLEYFKGQKA